MLGYILGLMTAGLAAYLLRVYYVRKTSGGSSYGPGTLHASEDHAVEEFEEVLDRHGRDERENEQIGRRGEGLE